MLHAEKMLQGRVSQLGKKYILRMSVVDVNTSIVECDAVEESNNGIEDLSNRIARMTRTLVACTVRTDSDPGKN